MSTTRPEKEIPLVPTNMTSLSELARRLATTVNIMLRSPIYIRPITSSDANAPKSTIYFSTDANKLVFKAANGTVNNLY